MESFPKKLKLTALPYKGAKFEAKEYLPTRSVAFDWSALSAMLKAALCASGYSAGANVKSSEGRVHRLFEQLG